MFTKYVDNQVPALLLRCSPGAAARTGPLRRHTRPFVCPRGRQATDGKSKTGHPDRRPNLQAQHGPKPLRMAAVPLPRSNLTVPRSLRFHALRAPPHGQVLIAGTTRPSACPLGWQPDRRENQNRCVLQTRVAGSHLALICKVLRGIPPVHSRPCLSGSSPSKPV